MRKMGENGDKYLSFKVLSQLVSPIAPSSGQLCDNKPRSPLYESFLYHAPNNRTKQFENKLGFFSAAKPCDSTYCVVLVC